MHYMALVLGPDFNNSYATVARCDCDS